MLWLYFVGAAIVAVGIFVLGARYGRQIATKARTEAELLKQDAERLEKKLQ